MGASIEKIYLCLYRLFCRLHLCPLHPQNTKQLRQVVENHGRSCAGPGIAITKKKSIRSHSRAARRLHNLTSPHFRPEIGRRIRVRFARTRVLIFTHTFHDFPWVLPVIEMFLSHVHPKTDRHRELLQVELWEGKLEDARACREQMHQYLVDALHLFPTDAGTLISF